MKVRFMRIVVNRETKEEIQVPAEIDTEEVQCVYKDRNGVLLSLTSGNLLKVAHRLDDMVECFVSDI